MRSLPVWKVPPTGLNKTGTRTGILIEVRTATLTAIQIEAQTATRITVSTAKAIATQTARMTTVTAAEDRGRKGRRDRNDDD